MDNIFPYLVTYDLADRECTLLVLAPTMERAIQLASAFLGDQPYLLTGAALMQVQFTLIQEAEQWQNTTTDELNDPLRRQ